ncbi:hypothetical protein KCH_29860 [Kitasatospora cheerisanensis KCTC 2395]|uniref:Uncharacterized protein n=1 Tax=Kitasatospora cheerisanensis KCTC 2395 TaxID=1348663 RepID=A0A066Z5F4_9ACTN|nr:hypothetical protein KCH_29860 [Kitasatospora cheerisanensis KCTC 2395]
MAGPVADEAGYRGVGVVAGCSGVRGHGRAEHRCCDGGPVRHCLFLRTGTAACRRVRTYATGPRAESRRAVTKGSTWSVPVRLVRRNSWNRWNGMDPSGTARVLGVRWAGPAGAGVPSGTTGAAGKRFWKVRRKVLRKPV